jgi:hypothetical protein
VDAFNARHTVVYELAAVVHKQNPHIRLTGTGMHVMSLLLHLLTLSNIVTTATGCARQLGFVRRLRRFEAEYCS